MGKNFKIFGVRSGILGDTIMSLPILNWLENNYPNSYKYFLIDKKCSQFAQGYFNHPLMDKILITEKDEGMGSREIEIANSCDIVINPSPSHPFGDSWPNFRSIYEETWIMAGLPLNEYHGLPSEQQRPKLSCWFNVTKYPKTVAIFPFAGYNREPKRSPSVAWYTKLFHELAARKFKVFHFGHFTEHRFFWPDTGFYHNFTELPFFEQIKMAVGCEFTIGTDSGSALIMGAYEVPQISLLGIHWPGHIQNPLAFSTNNPNNQSFVRENASDIPVEEVVAAIDNF